MRTVVVQEFVTIDGFAAGRVGELDFIADATDVEEVADELARDQLTFLDRIDTILLGAVTYRMFAGYWPEQTTDTEPIADALNATPKVVFSRSLERTPWGRWEDARLVAGSASEEVRRLKRQEGRDLVVWGSLSVARSLLADGLVDELQLWICPVLLGAGMRLFGEDIDPQRLSLLETRSYGGRVVSLRLAPLLSA